MRDEEAVEGGRRLLSDAGVVVVLTGAGISADSGVPIFRGAEGLWNSYRPEELATPEAFAREPRLVWEWYGWRRSIVSECVPNQAHMALAEWSLARPGIHIVTQNVDGLHTRAGRQAAAAAGQNLSPREEPLELHGSVFRVRCTACDTRYGHLDPIDPTSLETLPRCRVCDSLLRPDVVWFGEPLPQEVISGAFELASRADVCLVIGTSAIVQSAASLANVTLDGGGTIIEVNPDETQLSAVADVTIRARAAEVVPGLLSP